MRSQLHLWDGPGRRSLPYPGSILNINICDWNCQCRVFHSGFQLSSRFSENFFEVVTFLDRDPAARIPESAGRVCPFCSLFTISAGIAQPMKVGAIHSGMLPSWCDDIPPNSNLAFPPSARSEKQSIPVALEEGFRLGPLACGL